MNAGKQQRVARLIEDHRDAVNLGGPQNAPSPEQIASAEKALRRALPASYKWFLQNYSGGEIHGKEIYSIYSTDFESVAGGDIVTMHLGDVERGATADDQLEICVTDRAEVFFFDYSRFRDGECPVCRRIGSGESEDYGADFYEFLERRLIEVAG